ncbi:hypothetical protein HRW07_06845 [Streptomyces lunaelactis]|uniref:hypothetical protein n=1 Tax=Streptomyces lunaelactis TaxID=1535768 RepID=UPI001585B6FB|nr:hypothetical protein [Streptomyces lunaelactis]NUL02959.1 hypothetical protein [Streptomyces lunaelactis]
MASSSRKEIVVPVTNRLFRVLWGPEHMRLWATRPYPVLADDELDPRLRAQITDCRAATGVEIPQGALIVMLSCGHSMYSQVALEVFDHFTPLITDQELMFELLMLELVTRMGLGMEYRSPEP